MSDVHKSTTRRAALRSSAAGITAIAAFAGSARAAMTATEAANLKLVNDF